MNNAFLNPFKDCLWEKVIKGVSLTQTLDLHLDFLPMCSGAYPTKPPSPWLKQTDENLNLLFEI